jgi:hypothetical protein
MKKIISLILIALTISSAAQPLIVEAQVTPDHITTLENQVSDQVVPLATGIQYLSGHRNSISYEDWVRSRAAHNQAAANIGSLLLEINPSDTDRIDKIINGYTEPNGTKVPGIADFNKTFPVTGNNEENFQNALLLSNQIKSLLGPERAQRTGYTTALTNAAQGGSVEARQAEIDKEKNQLPSCNWGLTNWDIPCTFAFIGAWVLAVPVAGISAWISSIGNSFFNILIKYTVLDFATYGNNAAVQAGWKVARDLVNIFLIFIILYAAISIILQLGLDAKRVITRVVVVALLVNFSAFFTGIVIDTSNVIATQFYYMAGGNTQTPAPGQVNDITTQLHKGMDTTMATLKLPGNTVGKSTTEVLVSMIPVLIGKIALDLITTIIMFFSALMFLSRFITLIILIVLSPLAFMAAILPRTNKYWNDWGDKLIHQSFFAPVFFLMFYITVQITKQGSVQGIAEAAKGGAGTNMGFAYGVIYVLLVNGMMVASLMVANSLGASGAGAGMNALKKLGNFTRGAIAGTALGGAALGLRGLRAGVETATNPAAIGRGIGTAWRNFRNSTFNPATTPIGTIGGIAKAIGTGAKNAVVNTATTARNTAIGSTIGLAQTGVSNLTKSAAKIDPVARDIARAISPNLSDKDEAKKQKEAKEEKEQEDNFGALKMAIKDKDNAKIKDTLKKVSDKQIGNMDFEELKAVAEHLNGGQLKAATDRKDLTRGQKDELRDARLLPIKEAATPGTSKYDPAEVTAKIGGMKAEDASKLGKEILTMPEVMKNLSVRHLLKVIEELAPNDQRTIRTAIETDVAAGTATPQQQDTSKWFKTDSVGRTFGR